MSVDGVIAIQHGGIELEDLLHHVGAQAHAPHAVVPDDVGGFPIDGEAVLEGAVFHSYADGEDAVHDAFGQEGQSGQPQHDEGGQEPPIQ